ncbi:hypothetical protein D6833_04020, partial [Candidatus Parcubacteria bacterium]
MENRIWQAKLLAFVHDPAEKALVLLRGKGHEEGTVRSLRKELSARFGDFENEEILGIVKRADHWASAADRLQLPRDLPARVDFAADPLLIHPLTGKPLKISS